MATSLTQADVARLEQAIVSGELRVRLSDGREITYQSTDHLLRALDYAKTALSEGSGITATTPSTFAVFERD
ncbi:phage head-tail joining protein [Ancylobacter moscoviensis]